MSKLTENPQVNSANTSKSPEAEFFEKILEAIIERKNGFKYWNQPDSDKKQKAIIISQQDNGDLNVELGESKGESINFSILKKKLDYSQIKLSNDFFDKVMEALEPSVLNHYIASVEENLKKYINSTEFDELKNLHILEKAIILKKAMEYENKIKDSSPYYGKVPSNDIDEILLEGIYAQALAKLPSQEIKTLSYLGIDQIEKSGDKLKNNFEKNVDGYFSVIDANSKVEFPTRNQLRVVEAIGISEKVGNESKNHVFNYNAKVKDIRALLGDKNSHSQYVIPPNTILEFSKARKSKDGKYIVDVAHGVEDHKLEPNYKMAEKEINYAIKLLDKELHRDKNTAIKIEDLTKFNKKCSEILWKNNLIDLNQFRKGIKDSNSNPPALDKLSKKKDLSVLDKICVSAHRVCSNKGLHKLANKLSPVFSKNAQEYVKGENQIEDIYKQARNLTKNIREKNNEKINIVNLHGKDNFANKVKNGKSR